MKLHFAILSPEELGLLGDLSYSKQFLEHSGRSRANHELTSSLPSDCIPVRKLLHRMGVVTIGPRNAYLGTCSEIDHAIGYSQGISWELTFVNRNAAQPEVKSLSALRSLLEALLDDPDVVARTYKLFHNPEPNKDETKKLPSLSGGAGKFGTTRRANWKTRGFPEGMLEGAALVASGQNETTGPGTLNCPRFVAESFWSCFYIHDPKPALVPDPEWRPHSAAFAEKYQELIKSFDRPIEDPNQRLEEVKKLIVPVKHERLMSDCIVHRYWHNVRIEGGDRELVFTHVTSSAEASPVFNGFRSFPEGSSIAFEPLPKSASPNQIRVYIRVKPGATVSFGYTTRVSDAMWGEAPPGEYWEVCSGTPKMEVREGVRFLLSLPRKCLRGIPSCLAFAPPDNINSFMIDFARQRDINEALYDDHTSAIYHCLDGWGERPTSAFECSAPPALPPALMTALKHSEAAPGDGTWSNLSTSDKRAVYLAQFQVREPFGHYALAYQLPDKVKGKRS